MEEEQKGALLSPRRSGSAQPTDETRKEVEDPAMVPEGCKMCALRLNYNFPAVDISSTALGRPCVL